MNFLKNEINHFKSLPQKARDLLVSYFYFGATYPLIGTFINAFIWRKQGDIISLAFYNIGNTVALPISFYLNGLLLKRFKITHLYFIGALITALIPITVVFFPKSSVWSYLIFGLLFGTGYGLYWANRNYLTFKQTESHNRNYFLGLNFSLNMITGIVVPLIAGWFIFLASKFNIISLSQSYQITILFAFVLLFLSGLMVVKDEYQSPSISHITIKKITKRWLAVRMLCVSIGVIEGISLFFPTLLILTKLGAENILGSFNALIALISSFLIYYYGRKALFHHQKPTLLTTVILGLIAAFIFGLFFNSLTTIIYLVINSLAIEFMWLTSGPLMMNIMDEEKKIEGQNSYALIFDKELFLDLGRMLSFGILFIFITNFGQESALRFSPVFVYFLQLLLVSFAWNRLK